MPAPLLLVLRVGAVGELPAVALALAAAWHGHCLSALCAAVVRWGGGSCHIRFERSSAMVMRTAVRILSVERTADRYDSLAPA